MDLERDEFIVSYDASRATAADLISTVKQSGFISDIISTTQDVEEPEFFREALAKARNEKKPIVVDFTASWCAPCQRMLRETFSDPKVAPLLEQCVFVKVDTDEYSKLAKRYGAVALPDVRLLSPTGEEIRRLRDFQGPDAFAQALNELLAKVAVGEASDKLIALSDGEQELKAAFNRDVGKVRLVLLLAPT